ALMSAPLGRAVGNAVEVAEALEILAGGGPDDVRELTVALAAEMLQAAGVDADPARALDDGSAMDTWRRMVSRQGGDPDAPLPAPSSTATIPAEQDGTIARMDALAVGTAAWRLGAGRARKTDPVQSAAGIELHAKPGDTIAKGQPLMTLQTDTP